MLFQRNIARVLILLGSFLYVIHCIEDPVDFVNLLAGTFTDGNSFSTGNTLPLVGYPWGFNHWAPQTRENSRQVGSWWFRGNEHRFTWFRCTHQPSPWIGDWAWFLFTPIYGDSNDINRNPTYFWEPRAAIIKPHYFDATLAPDNIRLEVTPSMHGAMARITFPARGTSKRMCFTGIGATWGAKGMSDTNAYSPSAANDWERKISTGSGKPFIKGHANQVHIERLIVANFNMHVRLESDDATAVEDHQDLSCFRFENSATVVTVYLATSLISETQALINLNRELRYVTENFQPSTKTPKAGGQYSNAQFEIVKAHARKTWNDLLSRVDVVDPGPITGSHTRQLSIFYSGLMRSLAFPRRTDEVDLAGNIVHYSPYSPNGGIFDGPGCTDNGFWDTFRTVYPMLSLLYPDHLAQLVDGWLNAYREGGWLPSWASPGYRNCMVGTFGDVVVADAIVKNIKGFDRTVAKAAMTKDSFETPPQYAGNAIGKEGLNEYVNSGYIAQNMHDRGVECVSRTLDFGFADLAVGNAFLVLAKDSTSALSPTERSDLQTSASMLHQRAERAVSSLFKRQIGLMVPKSRTGEFSGMFSDKEWGNGFTEGNSWHHSFPPYAVNAETGGLLSNLHGGRANLLNKLHELLQTSGNFQPGSYGQEIHEMVEARAVAMGQYAHNNQPVHHILWLFGVLGERRTTENTVRFVLHHAYGVDFFAGDEDNGEQGAWYVLSALGLFATTPGTPFYEVGSPIFRHVRIDRTPKPMPSSTMTGNGATGYSQETSSTHSVGSQYTDLVALGTSDERMHVTKLQWNNGDIPKNMKAGIENVPAVLRYELLMQDGVLRFTMEGEDAGLTFDRSAIGRTSVNINRKVDATTAAKQPSVAATKAETPSADVKAKADKRIAELETLLQQSQNQVRLHKTVVSQLQEKLTHMGAESQINMTHLAVTAAQHHGLSEEILREATQLFRTVDHTESDTVLYEHMALVVMAIILFCAFVRYRTSLTTAWRGTKSQKHGV